MEIPLIWPKNIFKSFKNKLVIGFDPKLFTYNSLNHYFGNTCNLTPINEDLFYNKNSRESKINKFYCIIKFYKVKDKTKKYYYAVIVDN